MNQFFETLTEFNTVSVIVRRTFAMICGGLIGIERGRKHRPAGFRTHMLVCIGATLTMLISQYVSVVLHQGTDLTRFGAQVINGIGFLGAGTIIVTGRQQVKGLTTAAGLWASACMGLAIGAGFYLAAFLACLMIILTITLLTKLESWIMSNARNMNLLVEYQNMEDIGSIVAAVHREGVKVFDMEITKAPPKQGGAQSVVLALQLPKKYKHSVLIGVLSDIEGVSLVEEL